MRTHTPPNPSRVTNAKRHLFSRAPITVYAELFTAHQLLVLHSRWLTARLDSKTREQRETADAALRFMESAIAERVTRDGEGR